MTHSFQFDPNSILGVATGASLREIRDAYHQKSLKYHPDKGGDEWAFRMVARAYEILSTARVVDRADTDRPRAAPPDASPGRSTPPPPPPPPPRATWTESFPRATAASTANPTENDPDPMANIKGWSGTRRSHDGEDPVQLARIVSAELLILRFELECSLDLFARSPEDRNLSCTLHVTWPVVELAERAPTIPDAAKFHKRIGEALKARGVRKHALNRRSNIEDGRFEAWLTYPTAVMASEALEAFREALVGLGLELEKQVREMAIPRHWS
jgi:hypothetical protein